MQRKYRAGYLLLVYILVHVIWIWIRIIHTKCTNKRKYWKFLETLFLVFHIHHTVICTLFHLLQIGFCKSVWTRHNLDIQFHRRYILIHKVCSTLPVASEAIEIHFGFRHLWDSNRCNLLISNEVRCDTFRWIDQLSMIDQRCFEQQWHQHLVIITTTTTTTGKQLRNMVWLWM